MLASQVHQQRQKQQIQFLCFIVWCGIMAAIVIRFQYFLASAQFPQSFVMLRLLWRQGSNFHENFHFFLAALSSFSSEPTLCERLNRLSTI